MGLEEPKRHHQAMHSSSSVSTSDLALSEQTPVSATSHPMYKLTPCATRLVGAPPSRGESQRSGDFAVVFGADGSAYAGGVNMDGLRYGFGSLYEDNFIYEGEFEGGKKHGLGVELRDAFGRLRVWRALLHERRRDPGLCERHS